MSRRARWLASLQRELRQLQRDSPRGLAVTLGLALLASGGLAVSLWQLQVQELRQLAELQNETHRGLLDLRVTNHRGIVLDWGHWDPLHNYVGGQDVDFVKREVLPSPIITDGQTLLIVKPDGSMHSYPALPDSGELQRCLSRSLARLQELSDGQTKPQGFGFYCPAGASSAIGAGTAIRTSGNHGPSRGFLLHFSSIERPSYNPAVNRAFREISAAVAEVNTAEPNDTPQLGSISGLLDPRHAYVVQSTHTRLEQQLVAAQNALLPWLSLNLLGLVASGGTLLGLRRVRLSQRRSDWQNRSRLRRLRQELPGPLLTQHELLETIDKNPAALEACWISALRMKVTMFSGAASRSSARTLALGQLGERLQQQGSTRSLALGEDSNLLLVFQPESPRQPEAELQRMAGLLQEIQAELSSSIKLAVQGLITPLDSRRPRQQLRDLALVLSVTNHAERPLMFLADGVAERAATLRQQLHVDFSVNQLVENLREHRFALEPVMALDDHGELPCHVVYSEMLFRLPEEMDPDLTVQEVILSLERNGNVHLIDQLMLRKAIELLRRSDDPTQKLGINLSAKTFGSAQHLEDLMAQLRSLPEPLRGRIVLEVTETAIVEKPELWSERLQQLRDIGVSIAIDDFGVGFASIAYLFRFKADYLKLDLSYTQRLGDSNVNALVDFLLAYSRHNNCQLILEGIETREQLLAWHHHGVRLFQGYLFHREAAAD